MKKLQNKDEKEYKSRKSLDQKLKETERRADQLAAAGMAASAQHYHERANMYRRTLGMKPVKYDGDQTEKEG